MPPSQGHHLSSARSPPLGFSASAGAARKIFIPLPLSDEDPERNDAFANRFQPCKYQGETSPFISQEEKEQRRNISLGKRDLRVEFPCQASDGRPTDGPINWALGESPENRQNQQAVGKVVSHTA